MTRFAELAAVLNSGSSDGSATVKRLTGVCGSPQVSALVPFFLGDKAAKIHAWMTLLRRRQAKQKRIGYVRAFKMGHD
jgi:hypothetical protein